MGTKYDVFKNVFLHKVSSTSVFMHLGVPDDNKIDMYLLLACSDFSKMCQYDLSDRNEEEREFNFEIKDDRVINILTEGMVMYWMKPIINNDSQFVNYLNTRDFSLASSPANMQRINKDMHEEAEKRFMRMMYRYTYQNRNLNELYI